MVGRRLYRFKFGLPVRVSIVNAEPSPRVPGTRLYLARYTKFPTRRVKRACPSQRSRSRESRASRSSSKAPYRKSGQCRDIFHLARIRRDPQVLSLSLSSSIYIYIYVPHVRVHANYAWCNMYTRIVSHACVLIAADHTSCRRVKAS